MPAFIRSEQQAIIARHLGRMLAEAGAARGDDADPGVKLVVDGVEAAVPGALAAVLAQAAELMGEGRAVEVVSPEKEWSAQEAADQLGVSRPYLMNLLRKGLIPYRMVGSHHRLRADDVLRYQREQVLRREKAIDALARETEALGH